MSFTIKEQKPFEKEVIDLDGPDGNAFFLMGIAKRICPQVGVNYDKLHEKMVADDYGTLLIEMDLALGDYIEFVMSPHVMSTINNIEFKLHFLTDDVKRDES